MVYVYLIAITLKTKSHETISACKQQHSENNNFIKEKIKTMKTMIFKLSAFILLFALMGAGCGKRNISNSDPAKAIIGKWELVAIQPYNQEEEYKPTGYIEYLPDGVMEWYDYNTKKREVLKGKYWFDTTPLNEDEDAWTLHYELIRNEDGSRYEYHPDKPYGNNFYCVFENHNRMSLGTLDLIGIAPMLKNIYKLKN